MRRRLALQRKYGGIIPGRVDNTYDTATRNVLSHMTTEPDNTRKGVINDAIVALRDQGIWDEIDAMWVMAAHDAQAARVNWKAPGALELSEVNSPSFTADQGYQGVIANGSRLDTTGQFGAVYPVGWALENATLGVWFRTAPTTASQIHMTTLGGSRIQSHSSTPTTMRFRANDSSSAPNSLNSNLGHFTGRRVGGTKTAYLNAVETISQAVAADVAPTTGLVRFLAFGADSVQPSDAQLSLGYMGTSDFDLAAFHTIMSTYLTAVGAIP